MSYIEMDYVLIVFFKKNQLIITLAVLEEQQD
jgi:hypothetical protein